MSQGKSFRNKFKLTPLGVLLLVGAVAAVGAVAYYTMLQFTVTSSFTTIGVSAQAIQAGNHGNYQAKTPATSLSTQMHGASDATTFATNCVNVVALQNNLTNEDLRLVVEVIDHATGTPMDTGLWVATPRFVAFDWISGDGHIDDNLGTPSALTANSTHAMWTISHADIAKMTWVDISNPSGHGSPQPANDLLIPVTFGATYGTDFGNKSVDVKVWLEVVAP